MNKNKFTGKVIIAGAGPGDPELITLKALGYLRKAEVVITDRLVSELILANYVNKNALILRVGKQCRKEASTAQSDINSLLVKHALDGKLVVRLKGGDVSIFSNILDELESLIANHISYEIIPGITAASGAAAYSGIPLTARNQSSAVRLLTYYKKDLIGENYWKELAATDDTLVFYMSSGGIDTIMSKLIENHIGNDKYVAVIEQATTTYQKIRSCNIHAYRKKWKGNSYISPTLIIVGKVAALHEQFNWLENNPIEKEYFKPIAKKSYEPVLV
jgi:uroporphyrin-III C-methyltransferase